MAVNGEFFLLVSNTFEKKEDAVNFCTSLQDKCKNKFGNNFSHVGVSSWSIPQTAWGSIAVNYNDNGNKKWIACTNWNYSNNQELKYLSLGKAAAIGTIGAAVGAATIASGSALGAVIFEAAFDEFAALGVPTYAANLAGEIASNAFIAGTFAGAAILTGVELIKNSSSAISETAAAAQK